MLTIKHVDDLGWEMVFQATCVRSRPSQNPNTSILGNFYLEINRPASEGSDKELCTGKVYVMNETGKTVATYDMGSSLGSVGHQGVNLATTAAAQYSGLNQANSAMTSNFPSGAKIGSAQ